MSCLTIDCNGRFEVDGVSLHSGDAVEVLVGARLVCGVWTHDVWIRGQVEHGSKGYYFLNPAGPSFPLTAGLQARLPQGGSPHGEQG